MGTWGKGSFQNDWAMDWLNDLHASKDASLVRSALGAVVEHGGTRHSPPSMLERLRGLRQHTDWLTANVASRALAAAEVVAAWRGFASANLPRNTLTWLQEYGSTFPTDLVPFARLAVSIVKTNSELKDLWEEVGSPEWKDKVEDLERRLAAPSQK